MANKPDFLKRSQGKVKTDLKGPVDNKIKSKGKKK